MFDTHAHLDYYDEQTLEAVLNGISQKNMKCVSVSTEIDKCEKIYNIVKDKDYLYMSVGDHPDNFKHNCTVKTSDYIIKQVNVFGDKVIAIGETGLDYVNINEEQKKLQKESFIEHIKASIEVNKTLIIHTRNADEDTMNILSDFKSTNIKAIMHCFCGSAELMKFATDMGFYISFSGIVTFKNAKSVFDNMMNVDEDRIILETDSPFLAPVPMRGQKNKPEFVEYVYNFVEEHKKITREKIFSNSNRAYFEK